MANIFKPIATTEIAFAPQEVTTGLWTGDTGSLNSVYSSDTQLAKATGKYFVDVFNADPALTSSAEVQFSLSYGNIHGSGSPTLNQDDSSTRATQAIYLQMKNLLLDPSDAQFKFGEAGLTVTADEIYSIVISRNRFKGYVDPGNWQIILSGSNGSFKFIDDSFQTLGSRRSFSKSGLVFNIVSGSLSGQSGSVVAGATASVDGDNRGFGLFYPQKGLLVFDAKTIYTHVGFLGRSSAATVGELGSGAENTASAVTYTAMADTITPPLSPYTASLAGNGGVYAEQYNWQGLLRSIDLGSDIQARSAEIISSTHYFLRLNNAEFNYSNNPTFATGSTGAVINTDFEKDPKVYATSIGLYNNANELLAIAKLSRPLEKSFTKEALIRVRLDF